MHIQSWPDNCESEFLKALTHGVNERILDKKSMLPYTDEQAQRFMQVYRDLKPCEAPAVLGHERYYSVLPALAWHISRVMHKIETVCERYHYGTKKARLYHDIAVERRTWRDRLEDMLLFCVLFNSHRTYKDRLESTRPKGHVYLPDFRELIKSARRVVGLESSRHRICLSQCRLPGPTQHQRPCANRVAHLDAILHALSLAYTTSGDTANASTRTTKTHRYLRPRPHGHRASLTLLASLLTLPLAALFWAILSFAVVIATFCFVGSANVRTRTLLVFWDAWREQPTREPEEDHARGVGVGRELVREAWLKNKARRMKIARAQVTDGIRARLAKMKTAAGWALSMGRTTDGKQSAKV
ncbi:hypothetical protein EDB92DRAFT_1942733 [Lactarius akahatsu]|uniref:Uncharacterized protein n=1 Tax=Lactarius akahatsu TaxID=416441 RepID=A0AAD4LQ91_9AGAM|nr:hypothetical protein EDB92DRAFT_1942733 [Lactarius akahatsu]